MRCGGLAKKFGERFGVQPVLEGEESPTALLNNASLCHKLFGYPSVSVEQMIELDRGLDRRGRREPEQADPFRNARREILGTNGGGHSAAAALDCRAVAGRNSCKTADHGW